MPRQTPRQMPRQTPRQMPKLKNAAARAINGLLARAKLPAGRRARHDALVEAQVRRERQALGRDARPLHEAIRAIDAASAGLLMTRGLQLGQDVWVLGRGTD